MTFNSADALLDSLRGTAHIDGDRLRVDDEAALRGELMDRLAFDAVFQPEEELRDAVRWVIWSASQALGCGSSSIHRFFLTRYYRTCGCIFRSSEFTL